MRSLLKGYQAVCKELLFLIIAPLTRGQSSGRARGGVKLLGTKDPEPFAGTSLSFALARQPCVRRTKRH